MVAIKCKSGNVISACNSNFIDSEFILEQAYYKAQGCIVEKIEFIKFSKCNCTHCQSLEHKFHYLIEDIISEQHK